MAAKDVFTRLFPQFWLDHPHLTQAEVLPAFQEYLAETLMEPCKRCGKEGRLFDYQSVEDVPPTARGLYCDDCIPLVRAEWTPPCRTCGKPFRMWNANVFYCPACLVIPDRKRESRRVYTACKQACDMGLPATLTVDEWMQTVQDFEGRCAYCGDPMELLEHFIPIRQHGGTTVDNCVPGCYKCNLRKTGSHPDKSPRFAAYAKVRAYLATRKAA